MPRHPFQPIQGRLESIRIDSRALAGNLLGDPSQRSISVYLPPGHDTGNSHYPLLVYLSGYTSSAPRKLAWSAFEENLPQRLERLVAAGRMRPVVMAFPDSFTSLGGNQFLNSPVLGNWEDYLLEEMLPELERRFRVSPDPRRRALLGFSSGAYGALRQAFFHARHWGAIAAHSPDIGFELSLRADLAGLLTRLSRSGETIPAFLEHLWEAPRLDGGALHRLMLLGLAASYDPAPGEPYGIRLPVDPLTCEWIPERRQNWLKHDPLSWVESTDCQHNLRSLRGFFLDCGSYDQYHLQYGLRILVRRLGELGIRHHHQEFPGTHSGVDYRLDESLPFLDGCIAGREGSTG